MKPAALEGVVDGAFGGKAVALGRLLRGGIRVPDGIALPASFVAKLVAGAADARAELLLAARALTWPVSVRSSAAAEDSAGASHAGQFTTKLSVMNVEALEAAVLEIVQSAHIATHYRKAKGLADEIEMGIVVQTMLAPTTSGVLFTRHPVTQADEIVIEASWGLGEAVVSGLVVPDSFRLDRAGKILERRAGDKTSRIVGQPSGGTVVEPVPENLISALCVSDVQLAKLHALGLECDTLFAARVDVEWAFVGEQLFALQCRPITTS